MTQGIMTRILVFALALLLSGPELLAQGSTGGTLGKTDQSLSGDRPKEAPSQGERDRSKPENKPRKSAAATASTCKSIVGLWAFTNGVDVALKPGGTTSATNGAVGTWSCNAGTAIVPWQFGGMTWTDRYTVSPDGTQLSGIGGLLGEGLSARRK
jgi:hypothetical protein